MSEDYLKRFEDAKALTDIYMIARALKAEGVDSFTVNDLVAKAKKKLLEKSGSMKRINRKPVTIPEMAEVPTTQFYIEVNHLTRPVVEIHEDGRVIL